jgi:hypothetical protein
MTEDSSEAIFGYGSLILPPSVICRFDKQLRRKLQKLIQQGGYSEKFLDLYTGDEAVRKWRSSELYFVPVKVYGLKRFYSLESAGNGNKLAAEKSSKDHFINGVVIFPLDQEQAEMISETEETYETLKKSKNEIESYIPEEKLREKGIELPEKVEVYVATEDVEEVNRQTDEKRNEIYHQYIQKGTKLIAEEWFETEKEQNKFQKQFLEDFNRTTFEVDDTGKWQRISENN